MSDHQEEYAQVTIIVEKNGQKDTIVIPKAEAVLFDTDITPSTNWTPEGNTRFSGISAMDFKLSVRVEKPEDGVFYRQYNERVDE